MSSPDRFAGQFYVNQLADEQSSEKLRFSGFYLFRSSNFYLNLTLFDAEFNGGYFKDKIG
jgi:hypothetical protein